MHSDLHKRKSFGCQCQEIQILSFIREQRDHGWNISQIVLTVILHFRLMYLKTVIYSPLMICLINSSIILKIIKLIMHPCKEDSGFHVDVLQDY